MASVSISMLRGVDGFQLFTTGAPTGTGIPAAGSFVIGTAAPTASNDGKAMVSDLRRGDRRAALMCAEQLLIQIGASLEATSFCGR